MKNLSRVVWSEGMYLGPHHFQVQSRYFEDSIRFVAANLWFESWGVVAASLDVEALRNGTLSLLHARGIFPDGLSFHMPDCDPAPAARPVGDGFPIGRDKALVLLAVPPRRQDGRNCETGPDYGGGMAARYKAVEQTLRDETTGRDEKPVKLGHKNIRLLLDYEPAGDDVLLPIARIMPDGMGNYRFDPSYIPPALDLAASDRLLDITARLLDVLKAKSDSLASGKRGSWTDYSGSDLARFWMLHAIRAAIPPIRLLLDTRRGHPEELYREMARLAGALCTFALDYHPGDVPAYDHRNLDVCFGELDKLIRRLLETILPTSCLSIPLAKTKDYFWTGQITDQRCLDRCRWILAIDSRVGEAELITRTPAIVKVCSQKFVEELVKRALPGLSLAHMKIPPPAVPVRGDTQYFAVSRAGPCWDSIVLTRQVGVYVPGDLPDPQIELLVVLDS